MNTKIIAVIAVLLLLVATTIPVLAVGTKAPLSDKQIPVINGQATCGYPDRGDITLVLIRFCCWPDGHCQRTYCVMYQGQCVKMISFTCTGTGCVLNP